MTATGRGNGQAEKPKETQGIAANTLVIARALADQDGVTFRVQGTCMYPTIRPGDVLRIRPCAAMDVRVGDIAVIRKSGNLLSHRVISTGEDQGQAFIVTRPDRVRQGADSPTFDQDLLGIVASIERRGRTVPMDRIDPSWPGRLYFFFHLRNLAVRSGLRSWWSAALPRFQDTALYQRLAWSWLRRAHPRLDYTVRVPVPALGDAVYRRMNPEDFNVDRDWRGRPVQRFILALHLDRSEQPAASATFERSTDEHWVWNDCQVRDRYRGAGLEKYLLDRAAKLLPQGSIRNP